MKIWIQETWHKGQEVKRLQKTLGITSDGSFGPKTEQALKDFQSKNCLTVDGRSGPQTRSTLGIEIYPGIDVSHHQGTIDWDAVNGSGLAKFCWAKVTEGNNHVHVFHLSLPRSSCRASLSARYQATQERLLASRRAAVQEITRPSVLINEAEVFHLAAVA